MADPLDIDLPGIPDSGLGETPAPDAEVSQSLDPEIEGYDNTPDREVVLRARQRFDYVMTVESDNRENQRNDMEFAWERGKQWNEHNRRARETAIPPRPWLEFNQTGPYIKRITNEQRQNKPSITARPVGSGADKKTADIYSGLIRNIEYCSNAASIYDNAIEQAATGGAGYMRLCTRYESENSFNQVIELRPVANALAAFLDPDAQLPDKSDAKYGFVVEWIDEETYEKVWPTEKNPCSFDMADTEQEKRWFNGDLMAVADYYEVIETKENLVALSDGRVLWESDWQKEQSQQNPLGSVMGQATDTALGPPLAPNAGPTDLATALQALMTPAVTVVKTKERTRQRVDWYKVSGAELPLAKYEWAGKFVPLIMVPGDEIDINGKRVRQGVIRRLRDAQMMYNYWFTLATERIALAPKAPYIGAEGQFENHPEWDTLNTDNHPYLEYKFVENPDGGWYMTAPQRTEPIALDQGLVTMLQLCAQNLRDITGQRDAQVANPNVPWRAIMAEQRKGDLATFHYGDNLARAIQLVGKQIVDLIPHIYDSQRQLRVIDVAGDDKQVMVNQQAGPGAPVENDLTKGEYDVVVTVGPSFATRRVEAANEMQEFLEAMGPDKAALIADLFAEMTDWPNGVGDRVASRMFAMLPPQIQMMEKSGDDPQVAALKAGMATMQQQGQAQLQQMQQAMQAMQKQIGQLEQKNGELTLQVTNKQMEFQAKMASDATKHADAQMAAEDHRRGDDIQLLMKKMDIVVDLIELLTKTGSNAAAAAGPVGDLVQDQLINPQVEPRIAGGPHVETGFQQP